MLNRREKKLKEILGPYFISDKDLINKYGIRERDVEDYAFVDLGNDIILEIGEKKPLVRNEIYYEREDSKPELTLELFKEYNLNSIYVEYIHYDVRGLDEWVTKYKNGGDYYVLAGFNKGTPDKYYQHLLSDREKQVVYDATKYIVQDFIQRLERYWDMYRDKIVLIEYWAGEDYGEDEQDGTPF